MPNCKQSSYSLRTLLDGSQRNARIKQIGFTPHEKPDYVATFQNQLITIKNNHFFKNVSDAKHFNSNTDQSSQSLIPEPLKTPIPRANKKHKMQLTLYTHMHVLH